MSQLPALDFACARSPYFRPLQQVQQPRRDRAERRSRPLDRGLEPDDRVPKDRRQRPTRRRPTPCRHETPGPARSNTLLERSSRRSKASTATPDHARPEITALGMDSPMRETRAAAARLLILVSGVLASVACGGPREQSVTCGEPAEVVVWTGSQWQRLGAPWRRSRSVRRLLHLDSGARRGQYTTTSTGPLRPPSAARPSDSSVRRSDARPDRMGEWSPTATAAGTTWAKSSGVA